MTTLIDLEETTTRPLAAVVPLRPGANAPAGYVAPARFDVHQVDAFEQWADAAIDAGASKLVVDCGAIDFVDLAALESVDRLRSGHDVELVDPSLATQITLRLLGATDAAVELAEAA